MDLFKPRPNARDKRRKQARAKQYGLSKAVVNNLNNYVGVGPGWNEEVTLDCFEKVEGFQVDLTKFQIVDRSYRRLIGGQLWWVKPDLELVEQAASEKKALCVNKDGQFRLLESGFVALSHTWTEGLYADSRNRGLPHHVLDQVFEKLGCIPEAEWLWIDSLAVPGGDRDLSVHKEKIKVELINNMGMIYNSAETVVILDALVLKLKSTDPVDIAICLLCGRWRTRMWTYQEARLATNVKLVTGTRPVDFHKLVKELAAIERRQKKERNPVHVQISSETPSNIEARSVKGIVMELRAMFGPNQPSLDDIWRTCIVREAGQDIDYARALFPVLGLTWSAKFNREQGMSAIFELFRPDASNLVLTFGAPRLTEGPGWAPSYLNNLDREGGPIQQWTPRGLQAKWYTYKIRSVRRDTTIHSRLTIEFDQGKQREFACYVYTSERENEEAIWTFTDAVDVGKGHLLTAVPLVSMKHSNTGNQYRIAILVRQTEKPQEVQVCMTAKIFWLSKAPETVLSTRLLSHKSPLNCQTSDEDTDMIKAAFTTEIDESVEYGPSGSFNTQVEGEVHKLVRTSDIQGLRRFLKNKRVDLNAPDTLGWTPLHWAVVQKKVAQPMTVILLDYGVSPNSKSVSVKSPLLLAIEHGEDSVIGTLLKHGARQTPVQSISPLTQALYNQRSSNIIESLIRYGADVKLLDDFGRTPLFYASNPQSLEILLNAGADAGAYDRSGRCRLHLAAIRDEPTFIQKLVQFGCAVDILEKNSSYTPLYHAIVNQNQQSVRALLDQYANVNRRYQDGKTVLMHSIQTRNFAILEDLIRAGAKIDVTSTEEQWTPLHFAVRTDESLILNLLLEEHDSEAAIGRKDAQGMTASNVATARGLKSMMKLLERRNSKSRSSSPSSPLFGIIWATYMIQQYFPATKPCKEPTQETVPDHLHSRKDFIWEEVPRHWVFGAFHAIFSFDHFVAKVILFLALWGAVQELMQKRKLKKLPESKRGGWLWINRSEDLQERMAPVVGVVFVGLILYYMGNSLYNRCGSTIAVLTVLLLLTAWSFWTSTLSEDENVILALIIFLPALWCIAIWYSGMPHWETLDIYIGIIVPIPFGRLIVLQLLEVPPSKKPGEGSKYPLTHFGVDVGLYISFAAVSFCLGWQFLIVMIFNFFIGTWVGGLCLPFIRKRKPAKQSESVQRKAFCWSIASCLFCLLGILAYWLGWTVAVMVLLHLAAISTMVTGSFNIQSWKTKTFHFLAWVFLSEVESFLGWLKGGIFSFLLVLIILASQRLKKISII